MKHFHNNCSETLCHHQMLVGLVNLTIYLVVSLGQMQVYMQANSLTAYRVIVSIFYNATGQFFVQKSAPTFGRINCRWALGLENV